MILIVLNTNIVKTIFAIKVWDFNQFLCFFIYRKFDPEIHSESERRKYKTSLAKTIKKYEMVHLAMAEGGVVHYECAPENDEQNSEKYEVKIFRLIQVNFFNFRGD